jgi:hypothetical protein
MVATFNGWDDMPEAEREALERWEEQHRQPTAWARPTWCMGVRRRASSDRMMAPYPSAGYR